MRTVVAFILATASLSTFAASEQSGDATAFNCMDSKTLEINSQCMSQKIEANQAFINSQDMILDNAADVSNRAIATMTYDPKTFTIEVVAHKDALLAKIN